MVRATAAFILPAGPTKHCGIGKGRFSQFTPVRSSPSRTAIHPTGAVAGGVFAGLIFALVDGATMADAVAAAKDVLRTEAHHEETLAAVEAAEQQARSGAPPHEAIAGLGAGWVADEALAIAIYCALVARDFGHGVLLAVNHGGDFDSTGSIAGSLLGTMSGVDESQSPPDWLRRLELREVIEELADDLVDFPDWPIDEYEYGRGGDTDRVWRNIPDSILKPGNDVGHGDQWGCAPWSTDASDRESRIHGGGGPSEMATGLHPSNRITEQHLG